ncbi:MULTISPECIES: HD-GYP domain-containing protein [Robertmurraya]|uniref:HD-GYP domain-containing protein n=1 Tax=Robertmurraya beringensis TaxID=641660 RepID=A0ABV6KZ57_9BACI
MRLVATANVESGTILGKTVRNDKGQILLSEGVELNEKMLRRLLLLGITYIYIKDSVTEGIEYIEVLPDSVRRKAVQTIETTFQELQNDSKFDTSFVIEKASKRFKDLIRQLLFELKNNENLLTMLADVYTYDNYIFTHSLHVTMYSLAIGMKLKLTPKELEILGMGAILHDVGKMKVPFDILQKPGKLTDQEYDEIKRHPEEGFQMLRNVPAMSLIVAHCAYQHHERLNGTGYPRGIEGEDIHQLAKIIAVADVFDAVTSNRVYRDAMLPHHGLEILFAGSGTLFDPKIIEAFRKGVAIYPVGITVILDDGRKGVVSKQNMGVSDRPIVRIIEENGKDTDPYELDLSVSLSTMIVECDTTFPKNV